MNSKVEESNGASVIGPTAEKAKLKLSRRRFLTLAASVGAGFVLSNCVVTVPAEQTGAEVASEAPPEEKPSELRMLQWSSFVAEMDEVLIQQAEAWGEEKGISVTIERIAANDIPARVAASVQAQAGPDIIQLWDNWGWLFEDNLIDVSAEAEELNENYGGFYPEMEAYGKVNGTWRTVPYAFVPNAYIYRTDFFEEVFGDTTFPDTWDGFIEVGKELKEAGHPPGFQLSHSFGDPPTFWYPWLWSWGGREVEEDGETVALDSPETLLAVEKAVEFFDTGFAPGSLSWDDSSNNRAYLANQISATLNGASIYFVAKKDFPEIAEVSDHGIHPAGPDGRYSYQFNWSNGIMKYSNNVEAAKEFLMHVMAPDQYSPWLDSGLGYDVGVLHHYDDHSVWEKDPKILPFRDAVVSGTGRWPGWPGPPKAASARVRNDYIIVDLFAKACSQEFTPEEAVKWATDQLKRRYNA